MRTTDRIKKGVRVPARYAGVHGRTACPLCQKYPALNSDTIAAFSEIEDDEAHFIKTGKHKLKSQTLEEFLRGL